MKDENIKKILQEVIDDIWQMNEYTYQAEKLEKVLDYITNLQEENEFLKLNNPEMNMEHFRIIKENKRKIDNLREENKRLKEEIEILTSNDDNENVWLEDYNM